MSDGERGNTKHGPNLDDEMEQESRGLVQGHGEPPHAEPFRDSEPLPDDTDDDEVERAFWAEMTEDEDDEGDDDE